MLRTWACFSRIARFSENSMQRKLLAGAKFSTEKKSGLESKVEGKMNEGD